MSITHITDIIQLMQRLYKTDKTLLQTIILMVVLYAWIALISALFGIFYPIVIWSVWLIICGLLFFKKIIIFSKPSKEFTTYALIAMSFALIIAIFTVPTIFSGRDQGSLSGAAIRLSEEHTLIQHTSESDVFFDIYGRGKALNFPGFFYTPDGGLLTQFPLPYTSFIGGFFGIIGVNGFIVANVILLFTFILTITTVARHYMSHRYTLAFMAILLSSFSIGWFGKFTLSENIAGALLWSVFALYLFLKETPRSKTYFIFFMTLSLLLFTRIEGIWFFIIFIFLLLCNKSIRSFLRQDLWWRIIFPLTTLFVIALNVLIMNMPFFITLIKAGTPTSTGENTTQFIDELSYLFSVYSLYGLLLPLFLTIIASLVALRYKRYRTILLPLIVVLPLMLYYIFPNISGDHPWMLRRFVFALLPATILISVSFISYIQSNNLIKRSIKYIMLTLLFLANIPAFITFITYAENSTLATQVTALSQEFDNNDLILVDKNVAGNGWSMITNPLRSLNNKHAVYFFNPYDYDKINTDSFDKVFLVTSNENAKMYTDVLASNMQYVGKYIFTVDQLQSQLDNAATFPKKEIQTIRGTIYELKKK
ncbi:MAG: hypothetical protein U9Q12_00605 [Patescibacteria group bacterium]|nr:hypothetical protein [Patescibacteria group bacterium]